MPGEYTVVATFPGNANYEAGSATATLTITKSIVDIQINVNDVTYDGSAVSGGRDGFRRCTPTSSAPDSVTYNGSTDNPVNAGTYTVVATFNGTAIYEAATATQDVDHPQGDADCDGEWRNVHLRRSVHAASGTVTGGGGASLGTPAFTYNGAQAAPANAGVYNVNGTYAGDVNHNSRIWLWNDHDRQGGADRDALPAASYIYDGQPHPATGSVTGVGGVQLAGLTFTYNGLPEPPVNAGGYVGASAHIRETPTTRPSHATRRYRSAPATPTVTLTGGTFTYDGQPHGASATVTGIGGIDLGAATLTYDGSPNVPINAGTYVAVADLRWPRELWVCGGIRARHDPESGGRPRLESAGSHRLRDTARHRTAQRHGQHCRDRSRSHPPPASLLNAGASQTLTATFTPADPANYNGGSVTAAIDILKAAATVTAIGGTFSYDGQSHPATGQVTGVGQARSERPSSPTTAARRHRVTVGTYEVVATYRRQRELRASLGDDGDRDPASDASP